MCVKCIYATSSVHKDKSDAEIESSHWLQLACCISNTKSEAASTIRRVCVLVRTTEDERPIGRCRITICHWRNWLIYHDFIGGRGHCE